MSHVGRIDEVQDALLLFEALRLGHIVGYKQRLTDLQRRAISVGDIFLWVETPTLRRWTDGRKWTQSRVVGAFLISTEITNFSWDTSITVQLKRKTIAITLKTGEKYHLVAYEDDNQASSHLRPIQNPRFTSITFRPEFYHELPKYSNRTKRAGDDYFPLSDINYSGASIMYDNTLAEATKSNDNTPDNANLFVLATSAALEKVGTCQPTIAQPEQRSPQSHTLPSPSKVHSKWKPRSIPSPQEMNRLNKLALYYLLSE